MAGPDGRSEQRHCLLGELLADLQPLGGGHRHVGAPMMLNLFAVDHRPFSLVTD
jgi:hypothetical protein